MFEVRRRRDGASYTVYAAHKAGPQDTHTKFLVHCPAAGWRWFWAHEFEPAGAPAPAGPAVPAPVRVPVPSTRRWREMVGAR